jgi:signal transduction histidine kinase
MAPMDFVRATADDLDRQAWAEQYREPLRAAALGREMTAHGDPRVVALGHFHIAWAEMRWGEAAAARAAHAQLTARAGDDATLQALDRDLRAAWCRREHRFDEALVLLQANVGLDDDARLPQAHACSASATGITASSLHRMDDALRAFHRALAMAEVSGDTALVANAVGNLGAAHYDVGNLEDALRLCRQAQRSAAEAGAQGAWVSATINLILTLAGLQRADEAQALVDELVAAAPRVRDDRRGKYATVFADVARRRGELDDAQALLDKAAAARAPDEAPTLEWAATQAAVHLARGALPAAREMAEQRLERRTPANENDLPLAVLELREVAAQACEALGDLRAALDHQRAATAYRERLLGRSASARRIAVEVELQLALARQQRERAEVERERLAVLNDALHAANRAKSDFLAAASHDLRQPVHALALQVAALRGEPDSPRRAQRLDRIDACVGALSGLFDGLLDLSRIDAGIVAPQWQPVALALLLDELVQTHRAEAERKGLWLSLRLGAGAHEAGARSDPLLLERVLRNLIVNAVHHTRAGGVLVTLRARRCVAHRRARQRPRHSHRAARARVRRVLPDPCE